MTDLSHDPTVQLRSLVGTIDPAALTVADRLALLDLFERSHAASAGRLAHAQARAAAGWLVNTVAAADEVAAWVGSGTDQGNPYPVDPTGNACCGLIGRHGRACRG
jgi:hypothetical protein